MDVEAICRSADRKRSCHAKHIEVLGSFVLAYELDLISRSHLAETEFSQISIFLLSFSQSTLSWIKW